MQYLTWFVRIVLFLLFLGFAVKNVDTVRLQYFFGYEALAQVVLDLSGRPYAVVHAEWHTPAIGAVPTSLLAHFLESLAVTLRANLHARVAYGRDDHHQAEALFKALGRALLQAVQLEPRRQGVLPSSKGKL